MPIVDDASQFPFDTRDATFEDVRDLDASLTYRDLLSDDESKVIHAILSISWHDDWYFAQDVCFKFAHRREYWVRQAAITGLAHIARTHCAIDLDRVLNLVGDLTRSGASVDIFEDMFSDIMVFVARQGRISM